MLCSVCKVYLVYWWPLGGDRVSMLAHIYTHTNPWGRLKWPYAITRLTSHFMCGLMSDPVICKLRKSMVIHDTKCPCRDQVSLNNTNPTQPLSTGGVNYSFGLNILFHHTLKMDWTRQNATTLFPILLLCGTEVRNGVVMYRLYT